MLGELVDGVYDAVQVPDANVQDDELNVPPTFPSPQVIVPVGIFCEFTVSVTVAVNVSIFPAAYDAGFGDTVTDVEESEFVVKIDVPEFVVWLLSPP